MIILARDCKVRCPVIMALLLAVGVVGLATRLSAAESPVDVGNRKQLMIDKRFMADSKDITLRMNPPTQRRLVLRQDKPWETYIGFAVSVIEHEGQYKMWYWAEGKPPILCYAYSKDGIAWEKPNLGLVKYKGSAKNNIVMATQEATVFLDPIAPPPARFKAISMMHWPDPKTAGLYVHTSPDGIHWKISDQRVFPVWADTANQVFYDWRLKKYVANIRVWPNPYRAIGRVEMDDITKPWPIKHLEKPFYIWGKDKIPVASHEVPTVFGYDGRDPGPTDYYNAACVQYAWADDAYFLFPSPYRRFPGPPVGKYGNDGLLDVQMAVSRDGIKWTRLTREPYVAMGTQGELDASQVYMGIGMIRRGDKIFQYYGGHGATHGVPISEVEKNGPGGAIFRVEQRLDGFVSADAAYEGGEFTTPPLVFSGKQLVLNINASAMGTCKVELLDQQGIVVPGYSLKECDEIGGNSVKKTVSWSGKSDLGSLCGQTVRLRFVMRACKLFAFQFPCPAPLFDGKSFEGWEGNLDAFRIEGGAVVGGGLEERVPRNEYLCTKKEYTDFELRLKCKVLGKDANAGIQIRSERVPNSNEMIGYQADMGDNWWGCLYDERRHKLLAGPPVSEQGKLYKKDDWNEYVIRCQGRRIQLWLNGKCSVDYTEPDQSIPQKGVIGLQIHGGPPSEAWYKDITIKLLPGSE